MTNFLCNLWERTLFPCKEGFHTLFTEMVGVKFTHDIVQLIKRITGFLGFFSIAYRLVVPIVIETGIVCI